MSLQDDINKEDLRKKREEILSLKSGVNTCIGNILTSVNEMKLMPDYDTYTDQEIKDDNDNIIAILTNIVV